MRVPKLFIKPFLFMVILFGSMAAVNAFIFGSHLKSKLTAEYKSRGLALAQSIVASDIATILENDAENIQARIKQYESISGVAYVLITDAKGTIIAHTFDLTVPEIIKTKTATTDGAESRVHDVPLNQSEDYLHVVHPILPGVGCVHIGIDSSVIRQGIQEAIMEQLVIMGVLFAVSFLVIFFFFLNLSKPIRLLTDYADRVAAKDFLSVPDVDSRDEIGQLARAMRAMAWHISELIANLEKRVQQKTRQLEEARDSLKDKVDERTGELQRANTQLKIEIAERKVIAQSLGKTEKKYRTLFENATIGIYQSSQSGRFLSLNPTLAHILGFQSPDEAIDYFYDISTQLYVDSARRNDFLRELSEQGKIKNFESKIRRKDGRIIWIMENTRIVRDSDGAFICYAGYIQDISLRKKAEKELKRQAFHDPLTGLPNRALFLDHLRLAMQRKLRRKHLFAVLYMDLDRFKIINDSLGHEAGDELLCAAARVLKKCARSMDTVARFGGDEFALLLEELTAPRDAIAIARRILSGIRKPLNIKGHEVFTSASLGIVLETDGYKQPEALLRDADTAMYRAKELGKSRFKVFNQRMHDKVLKLMALETDLRRAVDLHEFEIFYQPIIDLDTQKISSFEALVRWQHPKQGLINPGGFISLAEDTGLICGIDNYVLMKACSQIKHWQTSHTDKLQDLLSLNINFSGKHFNKTVLPSQISRALKNSGLPPKALNVEITESTLMDNSSVAEDMLQQIKNLGVNICIDDFGTGYSSLSYLQRFPIDVLKVDRSFIQGVDKDKDSQAIVRTVFSLGTSLDLKVVAEGIETTEQLAFLKNEGCRYAQGFLFHKPLSVQDVDSLLTQEKLVYPQTPPLSLD